MPFTAELTAVKCQFSDKKNLQHFSHFCSKLRLWVEVKIAISEGSNGYPKSCFGGKTTTKIVSHPDNPSFTTKRWDARGSE